MNSNGSSEAKRSSISACAFFPIDAPSLESSRRVSEGEGYRANKKEGTYRISLFLCILE